MELLLALFTGLRRNFQIIVKLKSFGDKELISQSLLNVMQKT